MSNLRARAISMYKQEHLYIVGSEMVTLAHDTKVGPDPLAMPGDRLPKRSCLLRFVLLATSFQCEEQGK